ncbi:MAG TPA: UPF0182 family protein [Gemmatimonadaceae bacterium]|nr:UPF0182 family protein [Gemmatimonadaceae bacterium]
MLGRRWLFLLLAGAAIALLVGRVIAEIYTEYLWYASLGAADVWGAKYGALVALRVLCGTVATLFVFANLYAVRQSVVSLVLPRRIGNLDIGEEVPRRRLTGTAAALALLIGIGFAWTQNDWSGYLAARIGQPFGESDPYFQTDLGFFVYRLPFELSLFNWTVSMVLIVIGLVVALYALTPSLRWEQGTLYVSGYVRRHLAMLAGVLLLVLAWHYRLEMYTLLGEGSSGEFSYLDHRVVIPANLLLSLVTLGAGLTVLWAGWTGQMRLAFAALTGVIVAALIARQLAPIIGKRATADTDPNVRDRPYEATRAGYTRRAYAVDRIVTDSALRFATLADAAPYVPVWDEGALRRATDRVVPGAAVGWSVGDTGIVALLPTLSPTAIVTAFSASAAEDNGTPSRSVRTPTGADPPAMLIVADSSARPIVIADSSGHVNAPTLTSAGVRFAHALSMQDFRVWLGALPEPSPKLVARRAVRSRVRMLAPFFAQGTTVAPIWYADSLAWALELYATSRTYPLSQRISVAGESRAYFQHAATAIVNAATGRTVLVADSLPDPVTSTWMARFPRLFVRAMSLPAAVRHQLPPARDGGRAQAVAFGRFGTRGQTDVVRHLPDDDGADSALTSAPSPLLAFPDAGTPGAVFPLLDSREALRGIVVALGGPGHRSVWIPAGQTNRSWNNALDSLRGTDTVSASLLVRGYVRVVPVKNDVVLVQPRYDWRGGGAPRLLYVAALSGDSVRSDRTLLALAGRATTPTGPTDFRSRVRELYDEMRRANARGDFAAFGRAFDALGALLRSRREQP